MNSTKARFFTPKEAAAELGCHVDFIRAEILSRRMAPIFRINRRVIRIPATTLEAYRARRIA